MLLKMFNGRLNTQDGKNGYRKNGEKAHHIASEM